ncbi:MAG: HEAT repeat domain-containing protein [Rubripirellula sp.]
MNGWIRNRFSMLLIGVLFAGLLEPEWRILRRVAAQVPANDRPSDLEKLSSDHEADRLAAVKYGEQLGSAELKERRDAAYALAKLGPAAIPAIDALVKALEDRDEQVWMQSAMAVARIGPPAEPAIETLIENLEQSNDQRRYRAAWALSRIGAASVDSLAKALRDSSTRIKIGAIDAMGWMAAEHRQVVPLLLESVDSESEEVRLAAAKSLARSRSVDALGAALSSGDPRIQAVVAKSLAETETIPASVQDRLSELSQQGAPIVRAAAIIALVASDRTQPDLSESIVKIALSDDVEARNGAMIALRKLDDPTAALKQLAAAVRSERAEERSAAAFAIGLLGPKSAACVPALVDALKSNEEDVDEVIRAISRIGSTAVTPVLQAFSDPEQSRDRLARTLAMIGPAATTGLIGALQNESLQVQLNAASALAGMDPTPASAIDALAVRLESGPPELRAAMGVALAGCRQLPKQVLVQLRDLCDDENAEVRAAGLRAVARHDADRSVVLGMLVTSLDDPSSVVRSASIALLGELKVGKAKVIQPVAAALQDEVSDVRRAAAQVLAGFGRDAADRVNDVAALLNDGDDQTRAMSAWAIGEIGSAPTDVADQLLELLADPNAEIVLASLTSLHKIGADASDGAAKVGSLLNHADAAIRCAAVTCLATIESDTTKSVPLLIQSLEDRDWKVRRDAAAGLGEIGSPAATPAVPVLLRMSQNDEDRDAARGALRSIDDAGPEAVPLLLEALKSEDRGRRFYSAYLLGKVGADARDALPTLAQLRDASDSDRFKEMVDRTIKSIESVSE